MFSLDSRGRKIYTHVVKSECQGRQGRHYSNCNASYDVSRKVVEHHASFPYYPDLVQDNYEYNDGNDDKRGNGPWSLKI